MSSGLSSSPAGSPSTTAVSPGPCDSPAVTNRNDKAPTPYSVGAGALPDRRSSSRSAVRRDRMHVGIAGGRVGPDRRHLVALVVAEGRMRVAALRVERLAGVERVRVRPRVGREREAHYRVSDPVVRTVDLELVTEAVVVVVVDAVDDAVAVDVGVRVGVEAGRRVLVVEEVELRVLRLLRLVLRRRAGQATTPRSSARGPRPSCPGRRRRRHARRRRARRSRRCRATQPQQATRSRRGREFDF